MQLLFYGPLNLTKRNAHQLLWQFFSVKDIYKKMMMIEIMIEIMIEMMIERIY